jgi:hypothetical protein
MLRIPLIKIEKLILSWKDFEIKTILDHGIFICVHLAEGIEGESIYLVDGITVTPVACYDFGYRYITIEYFDVSHITIEEDELERIIHITEYELLEDSLLKYPSYYSYIRNLIKDYYILNTLEENLLSDTCLNETNKEYKNSLIKIHKDTTELIERIKGVITDSESNYHIEFKVMMREC